MNRELRKNIIDFLVALHLMQTENGRRARVIAAGLETILSQTELSGNTGEAVISLVNVLENYGTIDDTPSLVVFLREVATQVGEDKQRQLEGFCEQILDDILRPKEPEEPEEQIPDFPVIGPNPYKGLSAFQETDAKRFFGRESVTRALWERFCALHERPLDGPPPLRLLAILGPSGSGKSSVARAGLLPKLDEHPLPDRQHTRVADFTPGTHPLDALALTLARIDTNPQTLATKTSEFMKVLKQETDGQWEGLRRIVDTLPDIDNQPLILLIDQFEEVYSKDIKLDERRMFLDNLLCAAADPSGHVSVILTLRSDFLGQTQSHPQFNQAIARHGEIIPVMSEAELRDAIAKPAENAGRALDEACVDLLISQTRDREGALPLLQFALTRIWDGLTKDVSPADTLKQIGGVGGALAGGAQRLYENLSYPDKTISRRVFLALVQLGEGTRDTCRRISLTEIVTHGEELAHVQDVIDRFAGPHARLITLSAAPDGTETAEITHEALLDHWETLREWLDAYREDLRFHRHLAQDAAYWEKQGKPDGLLWRQPDLDLLRKYQVRAGADMTLLQVAFLNASERREWHSKRVRRMAVTALVVLTIIAMGAAGFAGWAYQQSQRLYFISKVQSLITYALQSNFKENRERAALLAWQAHLLNQRYQGDKHEEIEDALRTIFRTSSIMEEPGSPVLVDQVCRKVTIKRALEPQEWERYVGSDIEYEPACPELQKTARIRLRSEKMIASDRQALSLNLKNNGFPIHPIYNKFEKQGEVVIDHATGLMWQQSGSERFLTYVEAQEYVKERNRQKFAGYDDWRLPTIPELMSLMSQELQTNKFYLDPIFAIPKDVDLYRVWSADFYQTEDESSSGAAWYVSFLYGGVDWDTFDRTLYVRCVRFRRAP